MKAAVAHLEKFMEKVEGQEKGKIVLATVKGDVHDIGKNLVDIILTNNGYKVYNLGIKQPVDAMIAEYQKTGADYWNNAVKNMIDRFSKDDIPGGIEQCVRQIGETLKEKFPYIPTEDKNELPDEIVFGH